MIKFHITWFIDEKRTTLTGLTVEADNIAQAISEACDKHNVVLANIKYVIEI